MVPAVEVAACQYFVECCGWRHVVAALVPCRSQQLRMQCMYVLYVVLTQASSCTEPQRLQRTGLTALFPPRPTLRLQWCMQPKHHRTIEFFLPLTLFAVQLNYADIGKCANALNSLLVHAQTAGDHCAHSRDARKRRVASGNLISDTATTKARCKPCHSSC